VTEDAGGTATLSYRTPGRFARPNGVLADSPDEQGLPIAVADNGDTDIPSSLSATLDLLLRLAVATGDRRYPDAAAGLLGHLSG
jgi:uncharacterized protein YyaL (SSP411 family)